MTIGTLENATAAVRHHDGRRVDRSDTDEWKYLGCGAFRYVYLHIPTQVVYKVARWNPEISDTEVATAKRLRKMVWQAVYIPDADKHVVPEGDGAHHVVAMEYIAAPLAFEHFGGDWEAGLAYPARKEFMRKAEVWDMHMKNWLILDGVMIPIDMGDEG